MSTPISIDLLELMASKICHDLISPIGAVNNGIEFLEDMGEDAGDEINQLISFSAQQASAKLQAFRMAYGAGGADGNIKIADVYNSIESIVAAEKKIVQEWDPATKIAPELPPKAFCKILTCVLLLSKECLPKGGTLSVHRADNDDVVVTARGENAGFRDGFVDALLLEVAQDELTPTFTHGYITGLLGQHYGYSFKAEVPEDGAVAIHMNLPLM